VPIGDPRGPGRSRTRNGWQTLDPVCRLSTPLHPVHQPSEPLEGPSEAERRAEGRDDRTQPTGSGGGERVSRSIESCLTLALSGEAAEVPAKPAGDMIGGHHGESDSGLVRFNALLADARAWWLERERPGLDTRAALPRAGRVCWGGRASRPGCCCRVIAGRMMGLWCVTP